MEPAAQPLVRANRSDPRVLPASWALDPSPATPALVLRCTRHPERRSPRRRPTAAASQRSQPSRARWQARARAAGRFLQIDPRRSSAASRQAANNRMLQSRGRRPAAAASSCHASRTWASSWAAIASISSAEHAFKHAAVNVERGAGEARHRNDRITRVHTQRGHRGD